MGRRCRRDWRKKWCGILLVTLGVGMFFAILLPRCIVLVALALICAGGWLIYIS